MRLTLHRIFKGPEYTVGRLSVDGAYFCDTLEDPVRPLPHTCPDTPKGIPCTCPEKVYARTAIPAGEYQITSEYSTRFRRRLPYLHGVPHFLGVLIHSGNDADDTAGCILVGSNKAKGKVFESRAASDRLNVLLKKQSQITITIF